MNPVFYIYTKYFIVPTFVLKGNPANRKVSYYDCL